MKAERGTGRPRRDELRPERVHDTYKSARKLPEPTRCPDCGAVFSNGRWTWTEAASGANEERCPACLRIRDGFPAGHITIAGEFFAAHRDEILNRVRNCEAREKTEHPLERIIAVDPVADGVLVTTTSVHLARLIADGLYDAWKGDLDWHYSAEENLLRARWSREA